MSDADEIKRLEAEIVRQREYYEDRIVQERRIARIEGKVLGALGPELFPTLPKQETTSHG